MKEINYNNLKEPRFFVCMSCGHPAFEVPLYVKEKIAHSSCVENFKNQKDQVKNLEVKKEIDPSKPLATIFFEENTIVIIHPFSQKLNECYRQQYGFKWNPEKKRREVVKSKVNSMAAKFLLLDIQKKAPEYNWKISDDVVSFLKEIKIDIEETKENKILSLDKIKNDYTAKIDLSHLKIEPFEYQKKGIAFLDSIGGVGMLADEMGLGKCISKESLVFINGNLIKAEDIWIRHGSEASFDGEGYWSSPKDSLIVNSIDKNGKIVQRKINRLYRQKISEKVNKIKLQDGNTIIVTKRHKLLTSNGWTNKYSINDKVCAPALILWRGNPVNKNLVRLLAWQISDGYENKNFGSVSIHQKESFILKELISDLQSLSSSHNIKFSNSIIKNENSHLLRINSREYQKFLKENGYIWGAASEEKNIPDLIMQGDNESISFFLSNFFEAKGKISSSQKSVEISSTSYILINQLSNLLRRFGIWLKISQKTENGGNNNPYYTGKIEGADLNIFRSKIGFVFSEKNKKLEKISGVMSRNKVFDQSDFSLKEVFYNKIISIEEVYLNDWVYDFEVEEDHNFIANNTICHNTVQALGYTSKHSLKTIIVTLASIKYNWKNEVEKFTNKTAFVLDGKFTKNDLAKFDYIITNYEQLPKWKDILSKMKFDCVILDESHAISNISAARTKNVFNLFKKVPKRILLSGTPSKNRPIELYPQLKFLKPVEFPNKQDFGFRYCGPTQGFYGYWEFKGASNLDELNSRIAPFFIRRLKEDVLTDLPEKLISNLIYEMEGKDKKEYFKMLNGIKEDADFKKILNWNLNKKRATLTELIMFCSRAKVPLITDYVKTMIQEDESKKRKIVIFAHFKETQQLLKNSFSDISVSLFGEDSSKQRQDAVDKFRDDPDVRIFIGSTKAAGTGINLTSADTVIFADLLWTPSDHKQAEDRLHRIGQKESVSVNYFIFKNSIEEVIWNTLQKKLIVVAQTLGDSPYNEEETISSVIKDIFSEK